MVVIYLAGAQGRVGGTLLAARAATVGVGAAGAPVPPVG